MDDDIVRITNEEADELMEHYEAIAVPEYDERFEWMMRDELQNYTMLLEECFRLACRGECVSKYRLGLALVEIEEYKERMI